MKNAETKVVPVNLTIENHTALKKLGYSLTNYLTKVANEHVEEIMKKMKEEGEKND
jgi:hypothetical protein